MPQYKKVFDIGTYTGNGGQYRVGIPTLRGVGPSAKQVAGSTRFRLSVPNYLTRTPGSTTSQTTSTWSFWIKKSTLATEQEFLTAATSNHSSNPTISYIGFNSSDQLVYFSINNNVQTWYKSTTLAFRDTSVWTHFIVVTDTTNATSSNRIRIYVNGSEVTSWSNDSQPSQNATGFFNSSSATHVIGREAVRNRYPLDGYMSEVYFIDGQALTPSSFGEYNSDGIWVPKAYSGTYGTNGFYLPMNSSSNYATDQSGNSNNWTPTGFNTTTANTTYDLMTDSPTDYLSGSMSTANNAGNYSTFNPTNAFSGHNSGGSLAGGATFTNANLRVYRTQNDNRAFSTLPMRSGKWYWEFLIEGTTRTSLGISSSIMGAAATGDEYARSGDYGYVCEAGQSKFVAGVPTGSQTYFSSVWTTNDLIGVAFDADNGKLYLSKNGTWGNSGNPATDTNPLITSIPTADYFAFWAGGGDYPSSATLQGTINFGQRAFTYTPPSGYKSLNTYNITRPADSSLWFYGDTPDLMWIKNRSTTGLHTITDTVRGIGLNLVTSSSAAETSYPAVSEMNKFGMSIINDGTSIVNGSGNSMVYWGWKAGSNTSSTSVTNNDGAVTSQVSVNKLSGFSIVTGTTNSTGGSTFGHGLGVTPDLMIVKIRSAGSTDWYVYHSSLGYLKYLLLDSTSSVTTEVTPNTWGTSPTSSVFSVGGNFQGSYNTVTYLWNAIPGYSAFGSYTGNGAVDGPFVYLGFRPRWIMIKATSTTSNWIIYDSARDTYNPTINATYTNTTQADYTAGSLDVDLLSNGFKWRENGGQGNDSGVTYIYAAFAETPFKFARSR